MAFTSVPSNEKKSHWVRLQYDEDAGHYMLSSSQGNLCPPVIVLDGFEANKLLEMYLTVFFHDIEDVKRYEKMASAQSKKTDT